MIDDKKPAEEMPKDEPQTVFLPPQTGGSYTRKPDGSLELNHRTAPPAT